jgi:hypothetical protein
MANCKVHTGQDKYNCVLCHLYIKEQVRKMLKGHL